MIKSSFDDLYNQDGPQAYASQMRAMSYRNPDYLPQFKPIFRTFIERSRQSSLGSVKVVDLCSGYGVNSLILRYGLKDDDVYKWLENPKTKLAANEDSRWLEPGSEIVGIDIAEKALRFAKEAKLVDSSISRNLEKERLSREDSVKIADCDVLISTGSLSYISAKTVSQILNAIEPNRPLLACFWPLLGVDTGDIERELQKANMTVEHINRPVWQRHYKREAERSRYVASYHEKSIPIEGTAAEEGLCATMLYGVR